MLHMFKSIQNNSPGSAESTHPHLIMLYSSSSTHHPTTHWLPKHTTFSGGGDSGPCLGCRHYAWAGGVGSILRQRHVRSRQGTKGTSPLSALWASKASTMGLQTFKGTSFELRWIWYANPLQVSDARVRGQAATKNAYHNFIYACNAFASWLSWHDIGLDIDT